MSKLGPDRPNKGNAGKGRPKGVPNKVNAAIKDMVIQALDKAGGVDYLARQANQTPAAFMGLLGKVLPVQIAGDGNTPISVAHTIELVGVRSREG